jgi:hypothetical protein
MRRIRGHGLALSMVADPGLINITSKLSRTKELRPIASKDRDKLWKVYEDFAFKEKLVLAFIKRWMKVTNFESIERRFLIERRANLLLAPVSKTSPRGLGYETE